MNFLRLKLWMIGRKQRVSPLSVIVLVTLVIILLFFIKMVQTGSAVGFAFALSIAAGMSTCIGGAIVFFKRLVQLASPRTLSVSLSLSAGVMIFISLVEIFGKSVESYLLPSMNAEGFYFYSIRKLVTSLQTFAAHPWPRHFASTNSILTIYHEIVKIP